MRTFYVLHCYDEIRANSDIIAITDDAKRASQLQVIFPELQISEYSDLANVTQKVYEVSFNKETKKWYTERDKWADHIGNLGKVFDRPWTNHWSVVVQAPDKEKAIEVAKKIYQEKEDMH